MFDGMAVGMLDLVKQSATAYTIANSAFLLHYAHRHRSEHRLHSKKPFSGPVLVPPKNIGSHNCHSFPDRKTLKDSPKGEGF